MYKYKLSAFYNMHKTLWSLSSAKSSISFRSWWLSIHPEWCCGSSNNKPRPTSQPSSYPFFSTTYGFECLLLLACKSLYYSCTVVYSCTHILRHSSFRIICLAACLLFTGWGRRIWTRCESIHHNQQPTPRFVGHWSLLFYSRLLGQ